MLKETSAVELPVQHLSTISRWRRAAISVSLLMVVLAAFFIVLLSHAVDREMARMTTSSVVREQSDLVLLNLIEMVTAERAYVVKRDYDDYERFEKASNQLDEIFVYMRLITQSYPLWVEWLNEMQKEVDARKSNLWHRIQSVDRQATQNKAGLSINDVDAPKTDRLTEIITSFIRDDSPSRQKRREELAWLRAALTIAAIVCVVSAFVLGYTVIQRFRRDIRSLKTYQLLLHSENAALEERVIERTKELETARNHAEKERRRVELLLQDSSHRIGNSLATVSSLLGLQLNRSKNPEVRSALSAARDRIQTISAAHRRLRLSDDMETTALAEFLKSVVHDVEMGVPFELRQKIHIKTDFEDCRLPSRDATTLGIILGELLTNAIKHAFPDQGEGRIMISFGKQTDNKVSLIVEDNGVGIVERDDKNQIGLGKLVVQQLCMQFGEKPSFENLETGGTRVVIPLPQLSVEKCS